MIKSFGSIQDFLDKNPMKSKLEHVSSGKKINTRHFYHSKTKSYIPDVGKIMPLY